MNATDANRPLRVLEKVLSGGLGAGNVGVVMSGHGLGKVAVLTSIAIDHAMDERNALHVSVGKSVTSVRAFHDEVIHEILVNLDVPDHAGLTTKIERHKQIYSFPDASTFSMEKLKQTLEFLDQHAEFRPQIVEVSGWPDFETADPQLIADLKRLATGWNCEMWITAQTNPDMPRDDHGIPETVGRHLDDIEVLLALEPEQDHVNIEFLKSHGEPKETGINLIFDPKSMLIRWR